MQDKWYRYCFRNLANTHNIKWRIEITTRLTNRRTQHTMHVTHSRRKQIYTCFLHKSLRINDACRFYSSRQFIAQIRTLAYVPQLTLNHYIPTCFLDYLVRIFNTLFRNSNILLNTQFCPIIYNRIKSCIYSLFDPFKRVMMISIQENLITIFAQTLNYSYRLINAHPIALTLSKTKYHGNVQLLASINNPPEHFEISEIKMPYGVRAFFSIF